MLHARVRQTLEPIWHARRPIVASSNPPEDSWQKGLPLDSGGGPVRSDRVPDALRQARRGRDKRFPLQSVKQHGEPRRAIKLDCYAASPGALGAMKGYVLEPSTQRIVPRRTEQSDRASQMQRQVPDEHDTRRRRVGNATITISGIELMHRNRGGHFDLATLGLKDMVDRAVGNPVFFAR